MEEDFEIENFSHKIEGKNINQSALYQDRRNNLIKDIVGALNKNYVILFTDAEAVEVGRFVTKMMNFGNKGVDTET